MNFSKRNLIIITSFFGVIILTLAIVGFVKGSNQQATPPDGQGYTDPGSGEIIKSDKSPQGSEEVRKNAMIFPGFSKLIDRGLTPEQIQLIQSAYVAYSLDQNKQLKEVSLQVDSFRHMPTPETSRTMLVSFDIVTNRTDKYYTTVEYDNTLTAKTKIYASDKITLLFER